MPIPLAPLDHEAFAPPAPLARRALDIAGRILRVQATVAVVLAARLSLWLLFWPLMIVLAGCAGAVVVFACLGMWRDVLPAAVYGLGVLGIYTGLVWLAGGLRVHSARTHGLVG